MIEPTGIVTALGPSLGEIPTVGSEPGRPGPARGIDRRLVKRLVNRQILAHCPAIQPYSPSDLPEGLAETRVLLHDLLNGALARGGLRPLAWELSQAYRHRVNPTRGG